MRIEVTSNVDIPKYMKKINDKAFWTYAANEWWKLYQPYVPFQTGALARTVTFGAGTITHTVPYAHKMYEGNFNFRTDKHSLASRKWDKAAAPAQKAKLVAAMQEYINSGRLKLNG